MGKTGKWIRNFLTGKKDKERERHTKINHQIPSYNDNRPTTPISIPQPTTPREKRRWSFRRSSAKPEPNSVDNAMDLHMENDTKKHALAVAAATAAAADAAVAAAKAAAAVIQITAAASGKEASAFEEAAAVKIQSVFRAYLVWILVR